MILKKGDVSFLPLGLYFESSSALVISDTHIGFEKTLQKQGIQMIKSAYPDIKKLTLDYIEKLKPKRVVLAGDIKEDFGEFNFQEFYELKDYFATLKDLNIEIEVIRGNHDNYLLPFLRKMDISCHEEFLILDDLFITHGHLNLSKEIAVSKTKKLIFGHEHTSIMIRDSSGLDSKFKSTIVGDVYGKEFFALPAFSPLKPGTEVNIAEGSDFLSPIFRDADISKCRAHIFEDGE